MYVCAGEWADGRANSQARTLVYHSVYFYELSVQCEHSERERKKEIQAHTNHFIYTFK